MNRSLRRWHLRLVAVLAPAAVVTLAAAIAVRRAVPVNPVPGALATPLPPGAPGMDRRLVREAGLTLELRLLSPSPGRRAVELTPLVEPHTADLLVYWSAGPAIAALPADAVLLGPLAGLDPVRYLLPQSAGGPAGRLFLYTTAGDRVLGQINLGPGETPAP